MRKLTDTEILDWLDSHLFSILQSVHGDSFQIVYLNTDRYVKKVTAGNIRECVHMAVCLERMEK